jgi:predicted small secreted protein
MIELRGGNRRAGPAATRGERRRLPARGARAPFPIEEFAMRFSRSARVAGLLLALAGAVVSACNTVEGAGKDLERGGEKVQDAAKDVKQKM